MNNIAPVCISSRPHTLLTPVWTGSVFSIGRHNHPPEGAAGGMARAWNCGGCDGTAPGTQVITKLTQETRTRARVRARLCKCEWYVVADVDQLICPVHERAACAGLLFSRRWWSIDLHTLLIRAIGRDRQTRKLRDAKSDSRDISFRLLDSLSLPSLPPLSPQMWNEEVGNCGRRMRIRKSISKKRRDSFTGSRLWHFSCFSPAVCRYVSHLD